MCGIVGLVGLGVGAEVDVRAVLEVNERQRHRGPDDEGYLLLDAASWRVEALRGDDSCLPHAAVPLRHISEAAGQRVKLAIAHRRLSVLDPSPAGHQPMSSLDGRYHLAYNGEVYNYVELRGELAQCGWEFHSSSDTEVVLAALSIWGEGALTRLQGMFAFSWVDLFERKLILARDPFGIKPLHYTHSDDLFAFASEPAALLGVPGVKRRLDPHSAYAYLRHSITDHDERTFFESVKQLPPAHCLTVDLDEWQVGQPQRYWDPASSEPEPLKYPVAVSELKDRFVESVRLHLRSDVPIALMLSGGIDSSAVSLAARQSLGEGTELRAFGYVAKSKKANELSWMKKVASAGALQLCQVDPSVESLVAELERVICAQQAPFGSLSILAQSCVFRAVADGGFKVVLSGQGADELLGGYGPFAAARLASLILSGQWRAASIFYAGSKAWPGKRTMAIGLAQHLLPRSLQAVLRRVSGHTARPAWMNVEWFRDRNVELCSPRDARDGTRTVLKTALHDSLTRTNLPELLRYEDRNSMAQSVESRVPFLTTSLASFLLSLPESYIYGERCESKAVFRAAMRGLVLDDVLDRKDKIAFSAPLQQWFPVLQPWIDQVLNSEAAADAKCLDHSVVLKHWRLVQSGEIRPDNLLWRWVNMIRWAERFQVTME